MSGTQPDMETARQPGWRAHFLADRNAQFVLAPGIFGLNG